MIYFQTATFGDENLWRVFIALVTMTVATLLTRYFYKQKHPVDIHKTESETRKADIDMAISVLDRLPNFLHRLEEAHKKTLADETTIERLRYELEKCVDGHATCKELKETLVVFLTDAESVIQKIDTNSDLLIELRHLRTRLKK